MMTRRLILFKEPPAPSEEGSSTKESLTYQDAAALAGWPSCDFVPVLSFARENEEALRSLFAAGGEAFRSSYRGLIVTSQQAASCLADAFHAANPPPFSSSSSTCIIDAPCFTVGEKSKALLQPIFGGTVVSAPSAEALVPLLLLKAASSASSSSCAALPWLFVVGDKRLDTIPKALEAASSSSCHELLVYRTCALDRADIHRAVKEKLDGSSATGGNSGDGNGVRDSKSTNATATAAVAFVFFSPSGVAAVLGEGEGEGAASALKEALLPPPSSSSSSSSPAPPSLLLFLMIAIGKTTAQAMTSRGLKVDAVCTSPDPAGLQSALASLHLVAL